MEGPLAEVDDPMQPLGRAAIRDANDGAAGRLGLATDPPLTTKGRAPHGGGELRGVEWLPGGGRTARVGIDTARF